MCQPHLPVCHRQRIAACAGYVGPSAVALNLTRGNDVLISSSRALADAVCDKRCPSFHGTTIKYDAIIGHIQFNVRGCADGRSQGELNLLKNHYLAKKKLTGVYPSAIGPRHTSSYSESETQELRKTTFSTFDTGRTAQRGWDVNWSTGGRVELVKLVILTRTSSV